MDNDKEIIIIVDDNITNLTVAMNSLAGQYDVLTAPSGKKLFMLLEKVKPTLILLDIAMPEMSGYEVIKTLKSSEKTAFIPIIFLTAQIDPESEVEGLNLGAVDYITKPFSRELLAKRVDLHIQFEKQRKELIKHNLNLEDEVSRKTKTVVKLKSAILKTIAELIECRDGVTGGHIERTQHYLTLLVDFLLARDVYANELLAWDIDLFIMSSQLHDVGKISIRDDILMKPGKLTSEEFEEMKKHAAHGVDIIRRIKSSAGDEEFEFLHYAEILAGTHHEKWNGHGYPFGLKGYDIPLQGRLMAIIDVYDALTNDRPYKKAFTHEESVEIIRNDSGTHFDPLIVEAFLAHEKEFRNAVVNKTHVITRDTLLARHNLSLTLKVVANLMDARSSAVGRHTDNIRQYLKIFLNALSSHDEYKDAVSGWDIDLLLDSALLHDVGKMAINCGVLNKTGELTEDEFERAKAYADFGVKIVQQIRGKIDNNALLHHAEMLAGTHHEKWDGSGYPLGLKGKHIPLQGRIMTIIDVYDALVNDRPHRSKKSHEEAVGIIRDAGGEYFDPDLVEVFIECEREFKKVKAA